MAKQPDAPAWPKGWTPWTDDKRSAVAWFANTSNCNFTAWASAVGDKPSHWLGLEHAIRTITSLSSARFSKLNKQAVRQILGDDLDSKAHVNLPTKRLIGQTFSALIVKESMVEWKDEMKKWVSSACVTLAPRGIHLTKKARRNPMKAELPQSSDDETNDGRASATSKATSTRTTSLRRHPSADLSMPSKRAPKTPSKTPLPAPGVSPSAKRAKGSYQSKAVSFQYEEDLAEPQLPSRPRKLSRPVRSLSPILQSEPPSQQLLFVQRTITVFLDG